MSKNGSTVGVAIVGCGYWGMNFVRVFRELPETEVIVACDMSEDRRDELQRRFPGLPVAATIDEALRTGPIDAVVVCTPATAHYDVVSRALLAGKHVLVEKPMTTEVGHAQDLIELADRKGLTLMVGHTFLYNGGIRKVKSLITDDQIGRIYYLYSRRTNLGPIRKDVNALWDLAPHDVSIFNYLLDSPPEWVSAVGAKVLRNGREDVGFISFGYRDDIVAHVHVSWADPNKVREVVVVGSDRRVVFDDLNALERVRVYEKGIAPVVPEAPNFGEYHLMMRDGDIFSPKVQVSEPLKSQCRHFIECMTNGVKPLTDGNNGLWVVQAMAAVDRSMDRAGVPVRVSTN